MNHFAKLLLQKKLSKAELEQILKKGMQKSISLEKVKQTREEIRRLADMLSDNTVADVSMKSGLGMALEKIDKLIAESRAE